MAIDLTEEGGNLSGSDMYQAKVEIEKERRRIEGSGSLALSSDLQGRLMYIKRRQGRFISSPHSHFPYHYSRVLYFVSLYIVIIVFLFKFIVSLECFGAMFAR